MLPGLYKAQFKIFLSPGAGPDLYGIWLWSAGSTTAHVLMSTAFGSRTCKAEGGANADYCMIAPHTCGLVAEIKEEHKINDCVKPSPPPLADDKILIGSAGA